MRKNIIFGMVFLLIMTSVSAYSITGELSDNDILDLKDNVNLDVSYNRYAIDDETIIFYFDMDDYNRNENNGEFTNVKIRKTFEAGLDTNILISCLEENDDKYCYDNYINNDKMVIISNEQEEREIAPIKMQLNEEITAIRNKVESYKTEIKADRSPIRNFIESLNIKNILG